MQEAVNEPRGIRLACPDAASAPRAREAIQRELDRLGLGDDVAWRATPATREPSGAQHTLQLHLLESRLNAWMPGFNTLGLCQKTGLQPLADTDDLLREIWLTLLACPIVMDFPQPDELISAVRVRQYIVEAARKTALDFNTTQAERPADSWTYHKDTGFTVRPGHPLIDALIKATQPEATGMVYSFSCYRATEYVILLAIAQEARNSNPVLLDALQHQWEQRAVMSGRFHDVFLREYGSMEAPLPIGYYIPGDRVWFRNPDDASSDVAGFEGSWVFYLGDGRFPNFWRRNKPFNLRAKCVELYHWRHGLRRDEAGEMQMDEAIVERLVDETMADPLASERIFERMFRLRDPKGVYDQGGCMDTSRESPRWIRPGTSDIVLPGVY